MRNIFILTTILWGLNFNLFISLFSTASLYQATYEMLVYYIITLFLLTLFSFSKIINIIVTNTFFLLSIFGAYFISTMGIVIDGNMLNNIFSTDVTEAFELFNLSFFIYLVISFTILYLINRHILFKQNRPSLKNYGISLLLILLIAFALFKLNRVAIDKFIASDTPSVVPVFIIPAIEKYVNLRDRLVEIDKKNISDEYELIADTNDTLVVFILGESARGDRFALNGYERETTPKLSKIQNLVSFKNATSCHTSTLNSVPCLMTRVLRKDYDITIDETSFVQIYRDLGYKTYWFSRHSNQKRVNTFCEEAEVCEYLTDSDYDSALLKKLDDIEATENNKLVVLHTLGSHYDYNERVTDKYKIFKPLCEGSVSGCKKETIDNSYDNTIYYTDEFIAQIIEKLKNKNACVIYTSDHGESLGEKSFGVSRYGHSTPYSIAPKEQKDVPFILWFSDKFLENHKEIDIANIKNTKLASHDNIFNTVLGCGNISNKLNKQDKLNFCSTQK